jgi:hypothetical protein
MKLSFLLTVDTENGSFDIVNQETGEVKSVEIPKATTKKTTTRKKKEDESSEPQLILEENKYKLNSAAIELMGVEPEAKLNIKMRKINKVMTPILGTDEAFNVKSGNRLTKSFTVACRGANNEALAAYGTVFTLEANPDGTGTFILHGDKAPETLPEDENLQEEVTLPEGLTEDIDALNDEVSGEAETIDGDTFEAMLQGID